MKLSAISLGKFQWLFSQAPFKEHKLRVSARVFLWELHRLRNATIRVPFDDRKFTIHCRDGAGRLLYYFRSFDDDIFAFLEQYLLPGQIAVDVGANIGIYAAFLAKRLAPTGQVFAFEPNPDVFQRLKANASAPNVCLFQKAVGSNPGTVSLGLNVDTAKSSVVRRDSTGEVLEVECITLDGFFQENLGNGEIDYLKIDVEGFDYDVLVGAQALLRRQAVRLVQTECSAQREEMYRLLTDFGYRVCRLTVQGQMVPIRSPENLPFNIFALRPDIADAWIDEE